jgi:hypothetical protein
MHRNALEPGAEDEDPVGPRGDGCSAGGFRAPDGNRLNVCYIGSGHGRPLSGRRAVVAGRGVDALLARSAAPASVHERPVLAATTVQSRLISSRPGRFGRTHAA